MTAEPTGLTFRSYNAGKFNGQGPDLYIFSFYRADGSPGSALCVEAHEAASTRQALLDQGYRAQAVSQ